MFVECEKFRRNCHKSLKKQDLFNPRMGKTFRRSRWELQFPCRHGPGKLQKKGQNWFLCNFLKIEFKELLQIFQVSLKSKNFFNHNISCVPIFMSSLENVLNESPIKFQNVMKCEKKIVKVCLHLKLAVLNSF